MINRSENINIFHVRHPSHLVRVILGCEEDLTVF